MNYDLTNRYFKRVDEHINWKAAIIMFVIGFLLFVLLISRVAVIGILGLLLAIGGALIVILKKVKISKEKAEIPSDAEFDREVNKELVGLKEKALIALGLDEDEVGEIEPISFDNFVYPSSKETGIMLKLGEDGKLRSSKYNYCIIFFSANEVHCFTYKFGTAKNEKSEQTDVYFYRDVVSVSTKSEGVTYDKKQYDYQTFVLTTAGGTQLTVSLKDPGNAQRSINAMRSLLKAKKQQQA